jgi:FdhD protein
VRHEGLVGDRPGDVAGVGYCTDVSLSEEERYNVVTVTLAAAPLRDPGHRHEAASAGSSRRVRTNRDDIRRTRG